MLAGGDKRDIGKAKWVVEDLKNAKDFLTAVSILHGKDKNCETTIDLYNSLFWSFKWRCGFITREQWHIWAEVLIELSSVLWEWRDKFEPNMWLEMNAKIYEVAFRNFEHDGKIKSSENGLCDVCSRLFTKILFNFANHVKEGDKSSQFHLSQEEVEKISKMIGTSWNFVTYANLIEEKIIKHSP